MLRRSGNLDAHAGELVTKTDRKAEFTELRAVMLKGAVGVVLADASLTFAIVRLVVGN